MPGTRVRKASGPRLIVHDLAVGGHRFDDRLPLDQGNVDAGLVSGRGRRELNSMAMQRAAGTIFRARHQFERTICPGNISRGNRRRLLHLGQVRVFEQAFGHAVQLAPANFFARRQQRHIALDAVGFRDIVLLAPLLGGGPCPTGKRENLGSDQSVKCPQAPTAPSESTTIAVDHDRRDPSRRP